MPQDVAYQAELNRVARSLGLGQTRNLEDAIIDHCLQQLRGWVASHGEPETLDGLVDRFAQSLDIRFEEVHGYDGMTSLMERMDPVERPVFAALRAEFGDDTDGATVLRVNRQAWEPAYLALINCEGWHEFRRYFSKWHELVHRLLEGPQLTFAFRRTTIDRPEPEEVLVDRVTAVLAFFPDMFLPVLREETADDGLLTFGTVDRVRARIAPDASHEATLRACLSHTSGSVWLLRCANSLTAGEERRTNSPQLQLIPADPPEAKLRVQSAILSPAAAESGVRFHRNMRVPDGSVVAQAFGDEWGAFVEGEESLDTWQTSSGGPIGAGTIHVESVQRGHDEVWALVQLATP